MLVWRGRTIEAMAASDREVELGSANLEPEAIARTTFPTSFRGYDADHVRTFLERVAVELRAAHDREAALRTQLGQTDLIINCSSLGMKRSDPSPIESSLLEPHLLVFDTVYTAARTRLMQAADEAGARSANGLSMLLHQGALSFERWFHQTAPIEVMRAALTAKLAK